MASHRRVSPACQGSPYSPFWLRRDGGRRGAEGEKGGEEIRSDAMEGFPDGVGDGVGSRGGGERGL